MLEADATAREVDRPTPVFLLSLPRSGSTLVQRVLAGHPDIDTASEPWILLPALYALKREGTYAEYNHRVLTSAIRDFCEVMPNGREDYLSAVRGMALELYRKASRPNCRYFVDKTPRYHMVADTIIELFPSAKFVFLWRNPLAVVASVAETWAGGRWALHGSRLDLFDGLSHLISTYQAHQHRVCSIRYEDLIDDPIRTCSALFAYLGIDMDDERVTGFVSVRLEGRMGDPSGARTYGRLSSAPLEKWKSVVRTPLRREWCRRYLEWIGRARLEAMGYSLDHLLAELHDVETFWAGTPADVVSLLRGTAATWLELGLLRDKIGRLRRPWTIHPHW